LSRSNRKPTQPDQRHQQAIARIVLELTTRTNGSLARPMVETLDSPLAEGCSRLPVETIEFYNGHAGHVTKRRWTPA
jgi:hypothetical protein